MLNPHDFECRDAINRVSTFEITSYGSTSFRATMCNSSTCYAHPCATAHQPQLTNRVSPLNFADDISNSHSERKLE